MGLNDMRHDRLPGQQLLLRPVRDVKEDINKAESGGRDEFSRIFAQKRSEKIKATSDDPGSGSPQTQAPSQPVSKADELALEKQSDAGKPALDPLTDSTQEKLDHDQTGTESMLQTEMFLSVLAAQAGTGKNPDLDTKQEPDPTGNKTARQLPMSIQTRQGEELPDSDKTPGTVEIPAGSRPQATGKVDLAAMQPVSLPQKPDLDTPDTLFPGKNKDATAGLDSKMARGVEKAVTTGIENLVESRQAGPDTGKKGGQSGSGHREKAEVIENIKTLHGKISDVMVSNVKGEPGEKPLGQPAGLKLVPEQNIQKPETGLKGRFVEQIVAAADTGDDAIQNAVSSLSIGKQVGEPVVKAIISELQSWKPEAIDSKSFPGLNAAAPKTISHFNIQLHPDGLGTVNAKLVLSNSSLEVVFTATNAQLSERLKSEVGHLTRQIQAHGLPVDDLIIKIADAGQISMMGDNSGNTEMSKGFSGQSNLQGSQGRHNQNNQQTANSSNEVTDASRRSKEGRNHDFRDGNPDALYL